MVLPAEHNRLRSRSSKKGSMNMRLPSSVNTTHIAFVTNLCPHYRVKTYEALASCFAIDFLFFSAGDEWYLWRGHGKNVGNFNYEYLPGFALGGTRFTPALISRLLSSKYTIFVKCIAGKFALPLTYLIARWRRKPFILWTGLWSTLQSRFHRFFFPVIRHIYRNSDAIVVYGEHVKRYLEEQGVDPGKIFVAAHAVDNSLYSRYVSSEESANIREKLRLRPDQKVVLFVGRLEESKGLAYLVEAFAKLDQKDAVLVFIGEGTLLDALRNQLAELDILDRARFCGYVPQKDIVPYYAQAHVLVLPSVTMPEGKEQWGLVVNEAMNQGVPVIVSSVVGAAAGGLVQNAVNGYVVPERSSAALSETLRAILTDTSAREQMSVRAKEIISGWNNEKMILGFRRAIEFVVLERERATAQKGVKVSASRRIS